MFYLIARDLRSEKVLLVGNCLNTIHRGVIVRNYCIEENVIFVEKEEDIDRKCEADEIFCYKVNENEYVMVQAHKVLDGYIFYGCVQKEIIGYLDIMEYQLNELPMSSLKIQDKKKIINI